MESLNGSRGAIPPCLRHGAIVSSETDGLHWLGLLLLEL